MKEDQSQDEMPSISKNISIVRIYGRLVMKHKAESRLLAKQMSDHDIKLLDSFKRYDSVPELKCRACTVTSDINSDQTQSIYVEFSLEV